MSTISAAAVKDLRDRTNAPMMECKAALTEAGGDMEKAIDVLRKKLKGVGVKREGNATAEGRSEERRVGKECRSRWSQYQCKKKKQKRSDNRGSKTSSLARTRRTRSR